MELKKDKRDVLDHRIARARGRSEDLICRGELKLSADGKLRAEINMSAADSRLVRLAGHFCQDHAYEVVDLIKALKTQILEQGVKYLRRDTKSSYKCSWTFGISARGFGDIETIREALRSSDGLYSNFAGGVWRMMAKYTRAGSGTTVELRLIEVSKL